jgi:WD40 repeat protein
VVGHHRPGAPAYLSLYDVAHGKLQSTAKLPSPVGSTLSLSNDGRLLATSGTAGVTITLWDTSDPRHPRFLATVPVGQKVDDITFDPRDHLMADWNGTNGDVQVWDITNPSAPAREYSFTIPAVDNTVNAATFTPSGATIAVAGFSSTSLFDTDPAELANRLCLFTGDTITKAQWVQDAPGIPYQNPCTS